MLNFDPNLIKFQKIFQIPDLQDLYFHLKQFNCYLPDDWNQLDLFSFCDNGYALLFGVDKEDINKDLNIQNFHYYFLTIKVDTYTKKCKEIKIKTVPTYLSNNIRVVNKIEYFIVNKISNTLPYCVFYKKLSKLNVDYFKDEKRFISLFDVEQCKNAPFPVQYSMHLKEKF